MVKSKHSDYLHISVLSIIFGCVLALSFYLIGRPDICGIVNAFKERFQSAGPSNFKTMAVLTVLLMWFLLSGLFHDFLPGKREGKFWILQDYKSQKFSFPTLVLRYLPARFRFYVIYPLFLFYGVLLGHATIRCQ